MTAALSSLHCNAHPYTDVSNPSASNNAKAAWHPACSFEAESRAVHSYGKQSNCSSVTSVVLTSGTTGKLHSVSFLAEGASPGSLVNGDLQGVHTPPLTCSFILHGARVNVEVLVDVEVDVDVVGARVTLTLAVTVSVTVALISFPPTVTVTSTSPFAILVLVICATSATSTVTDSLKMALTVMGLFVRRCRLLGPLTKTPF